MKMVGFDVEQAFGGVLAVGALARDVGDMVELFKDFLAVGIPVVWPMSKMMAERLIGMVKKLLAKW